MRCETNLDFEEQWTLSYLFCPHCAAKTVWEAGSSDPELGAIFQCSTCGGHFYMPGAPDKSGIEKAEAIRKADHHLEPSDSIPSISSVVQSRQTPELDSTPGAHFSLPSAEGAAEQNDEDAIADNRETMGLKRTLDCWLDEMSGLPCLILLGDAGETLGYVGVPPVHPYYGMPSDLMGLNVHGGVTFVNELHRTDRGSFQAKLFDVWDGDSLYVIGFDCGHGYDFVPGRVLPGFPGLPTRLIDQGEIRDDEFVRKQCILLAVQLAFAAK